MGAITTEFLKEFALSVDRSDADAIFISCGGIRTIDVIDEIETQAEKPLTCRNQDMMWNCQRLAGINDVIEGYGRPFYL
jgi:maleate isomerase